MYMQSLRHSNRRSENEINEVLSRHILMQKPRNSPSAAEMELMAEARMIRTQCKAQGFVVLLSSTMPSERYAFVRFSTQYPHKFNPQIIHAQKLFTITLSQKRLEFPSKADTISSEGPILSWTRRRNSKATWE